MTHTPDTPPSGKPVPPAEKPADFSNVESGSSSTAPPPDAPSQKASQTYTIQSGDTLSKIAKAHYGEASEWKRIYEENRDTIKNPDLIYPGQVIRIP